VHIVLECATDGLGEPQAIARVPGRRQREVLLAGCDVAEDATLG
jgi:hypothetical protein